MSKSQPTSDQFVIDLLTTLRHERFSPRGWWHFLGRSWAMSCTTAQTNPQLRRSWLQLTLLISLLATIALASTGLIEGPVAALRLLPGLAFCVLWQQSDMFWHLGLNRQSRSGTLLQHLGLANTLTALRGLCTAVLLGRLIGGLPTPAWLLAILYFCAVVTDVLDGYVARTMDTQSRLGQIMDGEVDFCLSIAVAVFLVQMGILPLWLAASILLRFCLPLFAALGSYFLYAQPVRFGSTIWGKCAGAAQGLYFSILLVPPPLKFLAQPLQIPSLLVMLALLIIAPVAQIVRNGRGLHRNFE